MSKHVVAACIVFYSCLALGTDLDGRLKSIFSEVSVNKTDPTAYKGQAAGYYTGGDLRIRVPIHEAQLASIKLPSLRAGCGGIDLYAGSFSFINRKELKELATQIMNNSVAYGFQLWLDSVSPQIANNIKYFQHLVSEINQSNINSCEVAQALIGNIFEKNILSNRQSCQALAADSGKSSDWASARQYCGKEGKMGGMLDKDIANSPYGNEVLENKNVAWNSLMKMPEFANNPELAEFLMSLSGTMVFKRNLAKDDLKGELVSYPSLVKQENFLNVLLNGGTTKLYRCKERNKCLDIQDDKVVISAENGLVSQISKILHKLIEAKKNNTKLDEDIQQFLQLSNLPIDKMVEVYMAYMGSSAEFMISKYAEVIALDLLFQYLEVHLSQVIRAIDSVQHENEIVKNFLQGVKEAEQQLIERERQTHLRLTTTLQMTQETKLIEEKLASMLGSKVDSSLESGRNW